MRAERIEEALEAIAELVNSLFERVLEVISLIDWEWLRMRADQYEAVRALANNPLLTLARVGRAVAERDDDGVVQVYSEGTRSRKITVPPEAVQSLTQNTGGSR